jgi:hypothetical protein
MAERHHQRVNTLFNFFTVAIAGGALWLSYIAYTSANDADAAAASRDASKVTWYWRGGPQDEPAGIFVQNKGLTQARDITVRFAKDGVDQQRYIDWSVVQSCTWDSFALSKEQVDELLSSEAFMYFRDAENRVWRVDGKHDWQRVKGDRLPDRAGVDLTATWKLQRTSGEPSHCG